MFVFGLALSLAVCVVSQPRNPECGALRKAFLTEYSPVQTSNHPLIIGAGEGTTGTRWITDVVANITRKPVGHYLTT